MFLNKMRFQITTGDVTKEYRSITEAAKEYNLEPRTINSFIVNDIGGGKFQRRGDKKIFWIERIKDSPKPIFTIDGVDYISIPQILKAFNLREKNFLSQMVKNHFAFLDLDKNPHKVNWVNDNFVDMLNEKRQKLN